MSAILPPLVVDVRVKRSGARGFRIWFPFVILWPLLALLLAVALVGTVIADLALRASGAAYHHYTLLLLNIVSILPETRGTRMHMVNDMSLVDIEIY
jgi:ABC-type transport system involved in multi-copper enzyme maturation permease subunit